MPKQALEQILPQAKASQLSPLQPVAMQIITEKPLDTQLQSMNNFGAQQNPQKILKQAFSLYVAFI